MCRDGNSQTDIDALPLVVKLGADRQYELRGYQTGQFDGIPPDAYNDMESIPASKGYGSTTTFVGLKILNSTRVDVEAAPAARALNKSEC
jgi:hypothetical protein